MKKRFKDLSIINVNNEVSSSQKKVVYRYSYIGQAKLLVLNSYKNISVDDSVDYKL